MLIFCVRHKNGSYKVNEIYLNSYPLDLQIKIACSTSKTCALD